MAVMGSPHGCVFRKTSFTMFGAHCPFIPLKQLAESKVIINVIILSHDFRNQISITNQVRVEFPAK